MWAKSSLIANVNFIIILLHASQFYHSSGPLFKNISSKVIKLARANVMISCYVELHMH